MTLVERLKAPSPKFFRVLRSIGLALLAISGSVIAAPVLLPAAVVSLAGYLAVAGGVLSAVSQMTVGVSPPALTDPAEVVLELDNQIPQL